MEARATTIGEFVRQPRKSVRLPLRRAAAEAGMDLGDMSRFECGLMPAPQNPSLLSRLAAALRLEEGSEMHRVFLDLAAKPADRIAPELAADADLVGRLPLLFRPARKGKVTRETLIEIAEKIRGAGGVE